MQTTKGSTATDKESALRGARRFCGAGPFEYSLNAIERVGFLWNEPGLPRGKIAAEGFTKSDIPFYECCSYERPSQNEEKAKRR